MYNMEYVGTYLSQASSQDCIQSPANHIVIVLQYL